MKLLWSNLSLGGLYTDADADNNNDNNTQQTEHDCIGSLPNEPKSRIYILIYELCLKELSLKLGK